MEKTFYNIPFVYWGGLCLVLAVAYYFYWPRQKGTLASGWQYYMLRWGHSLVWVLLASVCFLRAFTDLTGVSNVIAQFALLNFTIFVVTMFTVKKTVKKSKSKLRKERRKDGRQ